MLAPLLTSFQLLSWGKGKLYIEEVISILMGDCIACGKVGWLDPGDGCFWSCVFFLVLFKIPVWLVSF